MITTSGTYLARRVSGDRYTPTTTSLTGGRSTIRIRNRPQGTSGATCRARRARELASGAAGASRLPGNLAESTWCALQTFGAALVRLEFPCDTRNASVHQLKLTRWTSTAPSAQVRGYLSRRARSARGQSRFRRYLPSTACIAPSTPDIRRNAASRAHLTRRLPALRLKVTPITRNAHSGIPSCERARCTILTRGPYSNR